VQPYAPQSCRKLSSWLHPAQVVLNPQPQLTDLPLKSYYRYALPAFGPPETIDGESDDDAEEGLLGPPRPPAATFSGLPGGSSCHGP
jgi:hypothetical protein